MIKGNRDNRREFFGLCGCCGDEFPIHEGKDTNYFNFVDVSKAEAAGGWVRYNLCLTCSKFVLHILQEREHSLSYVRRFHR